MYLNFSFVTFASKVFLNILNKKLTKIDTFGITYYSYSYIFRPPKSQGSHLGVSIFRWLKLFLILCRAQDKLEYQGINRSNVVLIGLRHPHLSTTSIATCPMTGNVLISYFPFSLLVLLINRQELLCNCRRMLRYISSAHQHLKIIQRNARNNINFFNSKLG